jgi:hypothetical protein
MLVVVIMHYCVSTWGFSIVMTMSEQVVPYAVARRINVKFLTNESLKPVENLVRLRAQFSQPNRSKNAGKRLKT